MLKAQVLAAGFSINKTCGGWYENGLLYCSGGPHIVNPSEAIEKGPRKILYCPIHHRQLRVHNRSEKGRRERQKVTAR